MRTCPSASSRPSRLAATRAPWPLARRGLRRRHARRRRPRRRRRAAAPTSAAAPSPARPARVRVAPAPAPGRRGRLRDVRRPAGHDHLRDVGRHHRARQPAEDRRRLPGDEPEHHGQGRRWPTGTTYWPKLQTDLAGGNAPDVFLMDGPAVPRLPDPRPAAGPHPVHRQGRLRHEPAGRPRRPGLHGPRRPPLRAAARPEHDRPVLQQDDVRRGRPPLPGRHLGLEQARRGRDEADQDVRRQDLAVGLLHRDDGHGELLVVARLAGRRRHPQPRQEDRGHRHRPGGGRHPVPPGPHLQGQGHGRSRAAAARATRSRTARPPWRRTAPGSSPPTRRRASTSAWRPLPKGPAGQATSVNPSGVVAYKGTKSPDAAWEFIKCYTGPELQAMVASLKASMPANKQVLTGQYATSFDGGKTFADALAYAHLKPSFAGYNEFSTTLQDELDTKVFNDNQLTAKAALDEVTPAAPEAPGPVNAGSPPAPTARRRVTSRPGVGTRSAARPAAGPRTRSAPRAAGRRGPLGPPVPGPDAHRAGGPVRRPDPGHARDQPDEVGHAHAPAVRGPRQLREAARRRPVPQGAPQHGLLHDRVRPAGPGPRPGPRHGAQPADPGDRLDPHRVLPAARDLGDRDRARLALDLQPDRPPQRHPRRRSGSRPSAGSPTRRWRCPRSSR